MTEPNPAFLAPCGLYCGVCTVYYATRDKNPELKERLGGVYKGSLPGSDELTPEDMHCKGCLSEEPLLFCSTCAIKDGFELHFGDGLPDAGPVLDTRKGVGTGCASLKVGLIAFAARGNMRGDKTLDLFSRHKGYRVLKVTGPGS